jgi:hypothetical protein
MTDLTTVNEIGELVPLIELKGIRFLETSSRLKEHDPDADMSGADMKISVQENHTDSLFDIRVGVVVDHPQADYMVKVGVQYATNEPVEVAPGVLRDMIEKLAIMAVFPYLREGIASLAARLEVTVPMLGIMRQGEFQLGEALPEQSAEEP